MSTTKNFETNIKWLKEMGYTLDLETGAYVYHRHRRRDGKVAYVEWQLDLYMQGEYDLEYVKDFHAYHMKASDIELNNLLK